MAATLSWMNVNATFDLSEMEDANGFFEAFKYARDRIGAEPPMIELDPEAEMAWKSDGD